ncbi:MAG: TRAP transporter small permease, partial [Halocynthiibacter sp.]
TVVSVLGRKLFILPVPGDYELVELGTGVAVFFFLPWCQLRRSHVSVNLLVNRFSKLGQQIFVTLGNGSLLLLSGVILWRLWNGFAEKFPYGSDALRDFFNMGYKPFYPETSYELQIPIWILYGAALVGALAFVLTSLLTLIEDLAPHQKDPRP